MTELSAGRVGRAHGLDGSFHVTRPRARLLREGLRVRTGGTERVVARHAGTAERPILRLAGIDSRPSVEALRGEEIWVDRADAPALEDGEFYAEDVVGLRVVDGDREVGLVTRLLSYPSCDLLDVERADGGAALLVPLVGDAVRELDLDARRVDVSLAFLGES